ncbi:MAG: hypothetical protein QM490_03665 [Candidatus Gracilibacteria bacterium]
MVLNTNNKNRLGQNNNLEEIENVRSRLSILFSGINFDLVTGEELINLGEQIAKNGEVLRSINYIT